MSSHRIKYRKLIVNRIFLTAVIILAQIGWFVLSILHLSEYSHITSAALRLLSLGIVMRIVCKDENPSYKIGWIILIFIVPVFGGLLYLLTGDKAQSKKLHNQISASREKCLPMLSDSKNQAVDKLMQIDERAGLTAKYLCSMSGYPVYTDSEVRYYPVGEKMFADMLEDIEKAEHFIFLEYFIIGQGRMWDAMLRLLVKKADSGVDVRIIYDDMGCVALLPPKYYKTLEAMSENIKCIAFNPVVPVLSLVMNHRDHRKILIIDGHTAYSGGINISDEYINETRRFGHWKDTGTRVRGSAALSFTEMFLEMWHAFRDKDEVPQTAAYAPDAYGTGYESDGFVQPFYDTPLDNEALSENLYIDIVNQAKKYVYIFTPYLILDDVMKESLCLAAKRGVDIRIVTPGVPDKKLIYRLTRANYMPLLRAGVRVFEYTPGFVHAKSFLSDDKIGIVGTINLDFRSLFLHFECGNVLYGCKALLDLRDDCLDTMEKSREITLSNIKNYYRGTMFDAILRMLSPLL